MISILHSTRLLRSSLGFSSIAAVACALVVGCGGSRDVVAPGITGTIDKGVAPAAADEPTPFSEPLRGVLTEALAKLAKDESSLAVLPVSQKNRHAGASVQFVDAHATEGYFVGFNLTEALTPYQADPLPKSFHVLKLKPDGKLDDAFADKGAITNASLKLLAGRGLRDGGLLLALGENVDSYKVEVQLRRYNSRGILDRSFGKDGILKAFKTEIAVSRRSFIIALSEHEKEPKFALIYNDNNPHAPLSNRTVQVRRYLLSGQGGSVHHLLRDQKDPFIYSVALVPGVREGIYVAYAVRNIQKDKVEWHSAMARYSQLFDSDGVQRDGDFSNKQSDLRFFGTVRGGFPRVSGTARNAFYIEDEGNRFRIHKLTVDGMRDEDFASNGTLEIPWEVYREPVRKTVEGYRDFQLTYSPVSTNLLVAAVTGRQVDAPHARRSKLGLVSGKDGAFNAFDGNDYDFSESPIALPLVFAGGRPGYLLAGAADGAIRFVFYREP